MAKSRRTLRGDAAMGQRRSIGAQWWRLARQVPRAPSLTRRAKARLTMLDWHFRHGRCVALTADHFGWSRPTVYRWLSRYDAHQLESLEDRSSRPVRHRRPSWTLAQIEAVRAVRERYPAWGKAKLAVVLRRDGISLSASMVGRIHRYLRRRGVLREPERRRIGVRHRGYARVHAVRKPKGLSVLQPGDLVQLDTLDVRPVPGVILKQFTARDVISRWDVVSLAANARAQSAVAALAALTARMPFPVRAISVDNGSEFMAEFEQACAARGIALYTLPPRSPKLNGAVERANRTHTEEFYALTDAPSELEPLQAALAEWEVCYNTIRPHQALGYLTPAEWLQRSGYLPGPV
jgi:transposase InsO family protein